MSFISQLPDRPICSKDIQCSTYASTPRYAKLRTPNILGEATNLPDIQLRRLNLQHLCLRQARITILCHHMLLMSYQLSHEQNTCGHEMNMSARFVHCSLHILAALSKVTPHCTFPYAQIGAGLQQTKLRHKQKMNKRLSHPDCSGTSTAPSTISCNGPSAFIYHCVSSCEGQYQQNSHVYSVLQSFAATVCLSFRCSVGEEGLFLK